MDYGEILSRAWQIISKHKILWLFGVLASCGSGGGSQSSSFNFSFPAPEPTYLDDYRDFGDFGITIPEGILPLMFGIACAILILGVLFFIAGVVGRVNLIKGTLQVEGGAESLSFGQLFKDSQPYLARALGLNLLVILAGIVAGVLIFVVVFGVTVVTLGIGLLCLIPLICLFIPISIYIGIVLEQANVAIVAEDLGVMDALKRGWNLARENLGSMIVMGLILILGAGIVGFIMSIPIGIALIPFFGTLIAGDELAIGGSLLFSGLCFIVYLPILMILNGILQSYVKSAWTLTFLRLSGSSPDDAGEPLPAAT